MTLIETLFEEMFFGAGFWIGFIIITAFALGISYRFKYSGVIFEVVLFFLAMEYLEKLSATSNHMWGAIMCFVEMIFIGIRLIHDVDTR